MKIKFHGCRGSYPISVGPRRVREIAKTVFKFAQKNNLTDWNDVEKALEKEKLSVHSVFGGATTCLEVFSKAAGVPIFIDCGTGLTNAGIDPESSLTKPEFNQGLGRVNFLMTHTHWDHIIGLPTMPQLYRVGNQFNFYGVHKNLHDRMGALFSDKHFPVPFSVVEKNINFKQIPLDEEIKFGELNIRHLAQSHPGGSFAYRLVEDEKALVFATDIELKKSVVVSDYGDFYENADVLIMDAQYTPEDIVLREGYGHSDIYSTVDFAVSQKAKKLVLFHQEPTYDDPSIDLQWERAIKYMTEKYSANEIEIEMAAETHTLEV